jgi:sec-independent protein translocase protein TatA
MGSGLLQPTHVIILLVIALLVLGPKRLPEVGKSLGQGLKGFKASLEGDDDEPQVRRASATPVAPAAEPEAAPARADD